MIYLEASALWTMYYGEPGGDNVIWLLKNYKCYTAEWMVLELCRAVAKKYNQGEINDKEARSLEMFILADIERLKREGRLELIRITWPLDKEGIPPHSSTQPLCIRCTTLGGASLRRKGHAGR
ncbi:MAG: hypothetical protein ACTSXJ_00650 [Candidatus Baldrarchaeia archaeon]